MPTPAVSPPEPGRRKTLALLVNATVAVIGGAFSALLGVFAVRPARAAATERWIRAGTLGDLTPNVPVPRVLSVPRADGWYRARARETVFLVWDGAKQVKVFSATCTHLGCQVLWDGEAKKFKCPCHGGVYDVERPGARRSAAAAAHDDRRARRRDRRNRAGAGVTTRRRDEHGSCSGSTRGPVSARRATSCSTRRFPPARAGSFTLGSVLLALISIQLLTGAFLTLYYAPTPDHAYESVRFISSTTSGRLVRGLHHFGASFLVVFLVLHLLRVVVLGSYKPPREITWLSGLALMGLVLAFALTGYLLPWDQRAYWATVVTINISRLAPIAGDAMAAVLQGGSTIGALTLTRWYSAHVIFLPALLVGLIVAHLVLMRLQGSSGPGAPEARRAVSVLPVPGVPRHGGGLRSCSSRSWRWRGAACRRSRARPIRPMPTTSRGPSGISSGCSSC